MADKYKVGGYYLFGNYMQGDSATEKTPIEWQILNIGKGKVTLISRYILDVDEGFDDEAWDSADKEKCPFLPNPLYWMDVNEWLEEKFKNTAFSAEEQKLIEGEICVPCVDDLLKYYSPDIHKLMSIECNIKSTVGVFGKELIATGTTYALKRGLSEKTWGEEDRDKLWKDVQFRDSYYDDFEEQLRLGDYIASPDEIIGKTVSPWRLYQGYYVGLDASAGYVSSSAQDKEMRKSIVGIRPMITLKPADADSFDWPEMWTDFSGLSDAIEKCREKIKTYPPAAYEDIQRCEDELKNRMEIEKVLPDEYIFFLMTANGISSSEMSLYGTDSLLKYNPEPGGSICIGSREWWEGEYSPKSHRYTYFYKPYDDSYLRKYEYDIEICYDEAYSFAEFLKLVNGQLYELMMHGGADGR